MLMVFMKLLNSFKKLALGATLSLGLSAMAGPGLSYTPISYSFINNGTYVAITNGINWTFDTASNVWFAPFNQFTNVYSGTTNGNANLNTWPPAIVDVTVPSDGNGDANPNLSIQVVIGLTNNFYVFSGAYQATNAGAIANSVMSPVIRNAIATNNITSVIGQGTNTLTFTFAPVAEPYGISMPSSGWISDKAFTFAVACTNNQATVFTTNLPTTFTQGLTKVRLIKITTDNQTGGVGTVIDAITLRGWSP